LTALASLSGPLPWIALAAATAVFLLVDLYIFRPREVRDAALWTVFWTLLSFAAALPLWAFVSGHAALAYTTVYVVTRALSFDNLLVFIILFAYFDVPREKRNELLVLGIVGMLVLRGLAILGGLGLIHSLHAVVYVLGALLIVLAVRVWRGVEESVRPERNVAARVMRRFGANPFLVCLGAVVTADIAFAIDSIPAGFAITGNSFLIWMGNVFSLLGLPALFVLVRELIRRFRYLDETIALVLVFVGLKLIVARWWHPGTALTLGIVVALFALGMAASFAAGDRFRRDGPGASG
jgi:tellurite resistance protein TerC